MCLFPLPAFQSSPGVKPVLYSSNTPVQSINFSDPRVIMLPCGQCHACRIKRSRDWAIRCVHEAAQWPCNCFITLTYDPLFLPHYPDKTGLLHPTLYKRDFTLFMKRLRKEHGDNIRFFMCGEYGSRGGRPHYHACLFNFDFIDKTFWRLKDGIKLYRSASLERLWPFGFTTIGDVTYDSAAYCARYIVKKITGSSASKHYGVRTPEFTNCSRRPGIASGFFKRFQSDVFPKDFVTLRGKKFNPPRYYDKIYDSFHHEDMLQIKNERRKRVVEYDPLASLAKEKVMKYQYKRLSRHLEEEV